MTSDRTKFISEVDTGQNVMKVNSPFKMYKDKNRRFIRLEISEFLIFGVLKDSNGGYFPQGDGPEYQGRILNLSQGGALLEGSDPLEEGTMLVLKMSLQEVELLDNVIGIVKRCDNFEDGWLMGIEFIERQYLQDNLSAPELDLLSEDLMSFNEQVSRVLGRYVYHEKVSEEENKDEIK